LRFGVGLAATLCPKWTFTIKKQYAFLGALMILPLLMKSGTFPPFVATPLLQPSNNMAWRNVKAPFSQPKNRLIKMLRELLSEDLYILEAPRRQQGYPRTPKGGDVLRKCAQVNASEWW
jgi:hypothetical protein